MRTKKVKLQVLQEITVEQQHKVAQPEDVMEIMQKIIMLEPKEVQAQERIWAVLLGNSQMIKKVVLVAAGGFTECHVDLKVLLRDALINGCGRIILVHNHPSGDPMPSADDVNLTDRIKRGCQTVDIKLIDHIIVGSDRFYSFARETPGIF